MVHSVEAIGFFVPFQKREVNDPERLEILWIPKVQRSSHVQAQLIQLTANLMEITGKHQD